MQSQIIATDIHVRQQLEYGSTVQQLKHKWCTGIKVKVILGNGAERVELKS